MTKEFPHFQPGKAVIFSAPGNLLEQLIEKEYTFNNFEEPFGFTAHQNQYGQV